MPAGGYQYSLKVNHQTNHRRRRNRPKPNGCPRPLRIFTRRHVFLVIQGLRINAQRKPNKSRYTAENPYYQRSSYHPTAYNESSSWLALTRTSAIVICCPDQLVIAGLERNSTTLGRGFAHTPRRKNNSNAQKIGSFFIVSTPRLRLLVKVLAAESNISNGLMPKNCSAM